MNDKARQTLIEIVRKYGTAIVSDPRRLEGLLRDLCPECNREINILMAGVKSGVAEVLSTGNTPVALAVPQMEKRLVDDFAMADSAAQWVVESWAKALGLDISGVVRSNPKGPTSQPVVTSPRSAAKPSQIIQSNFTCPVSGIEFVSVIGGEFDYQAGLSALMKKPWGKKAVRIAIAIGRDAQHECLEKFIDNAEIPILQANNPEALVKFIKWVSTQVLKEASSPASQSKAEGGNVIHVPAPPADSGLASAPDVW